MPKILCDPSVLRGKEKRGLAALGNHNKSFWTLVFKPRIFGCSKSVRLSFLLGGWNMNCEGVPTPSFLSLWGPMSPMTEWGIKGPFIGAPLVICWPSWIIEEFYPPQTPLQPGTYLPKGWYQRLVLLQSAHWLQIPDLLMSQPDFLELSCKLRQLNS